MAAARGGWDDFESATQGIFFRLIETILCGAMLVNIRSYAFVKTQRTTQHKKVTFSVYIY